MRDVAARAGVSLKTVSRVLNDEPGVSGGLAERVRQASSDLDYRPNLTASNLRRSDQRTSTIGLLVEDVSNPFFALIHRGVEDTASALGVGVLAASLDQDPDLERRLVTAFASRRVDGLVLAPTQREQAYLANEIRAGMPVVFVDRVPKGVEADVVITDNREATREGVRHLLNHGHRDIALLGGAIDLYTATERLAGFRQAVEQAGLTVRPEFVRRDLLSVEAAEQATTALLNCPQPPTAIFAAQNFLSIGAVRALHRAARQHEVALVGFDDFELADVLSPSVTVIAQDPRRIGQVAAEMLFARMADPLRPATTAVVHSRFIARQSSEIPLPGRDDQLLS